MRTGESGRILESEHVGCVGDAGSETVRAIRVESVDEGLTVMVVIHTGAHTDRGFCVRRVDQADAGGKVLLLLRPICGCMVGFAGRRERDQWLVNLALM